MTRRRCSRAALRSLAFCDEIVVVVDDRTTDAHRGDRASRTPTGARASRSRTSRQIRNAGDRVRRTRRLDPPRRRRRARSRRRSRRQIRAAPSAADPPELRASARADDQLLLGPAGWSTAAGPDDAGAADAPRARVLRAAGCTSRRASRRTGSATLTASAGTSRTARSRRTCVKAIRYGRLDAQDRFERGAPPRHGVAPRPGDRRSSSAAGWCAARGYRDGMPGVIEALFQPVRAVLRRGDAVGAPAGRRDRPRVRRARARARRELRQQPAGGVGQVVGVVVELGHRLVEAADEDAQRADPRRRPPCRRRGRRSRRWRRARSRARRAARSNMPVPGLRQSQPPSCGQWLDRVDAPAARSTSARMRAWISSRSSSVIRPRAMPRWLVTTTTGTPALLQPPQRLRARPAGTRTRPRRDVLALRRLAVDDPVAVEEDGAQATIAARPARTAMWATSVWASWIRGVSSRRHHDADVAQRRAASRRRRR